MKAMIASHFKTKIAVGDKLENSMICAIAGVGNAPYVKNEMFCEFCKIKGHTSYKGGKLFCFKLIKKLKTTEQTMTTTVIIIIITADIDLKDNVTSAKEIIKKKTALKRMMKESIDYLSHVFEHMMYL